MGSSTEMYCCGWFLSSTRTRMLRTDFDAHAIEALQCQKVKMQLKLNDLRQYPYPYIVGTFGMLSSVLFIHD